MSASPLLVFSSALVWTDSYDRAHPGNSLCHHPRAPFHPLLVWSAFFQNIMSLSCWSTPLFAGIQPRNFLRRGKIYMSGNLSLYTNANRLTGCRNPGWTSCFFRFPKMSFLLAASVSTETFHTSLILTLCFSVEDPRIFLSCQCADTSLGCILVWVYFHLLCWALLL